MQPGRDASTSPSSPISGRTCSTRADARETVTTIGLTEKPVCAKKTGCPTGGDPAATEENQESYFVRLKVEAVCYAYFEYADLSWKQGSPWEPFWGLFADDRTPKLFIGRNQP